MLMYALIGLSLVLVGIAGLQFSYLFYADRLQKERRKHLHDLEQRNATLKLQLAEAHHRIEEQDAIIASLCPETVSEDEAWADVIEER